MCKGRLLLVTYYWPPSGNVGVLRWLQLANEFVELGWDVTVYHPSNAAYAIRDEALLEQVNPAIKSIAKPIVEPNQYLKNKSADGFSDSTPSLWTKIKRNIRANYFIPDARALWIRPSVRFLQKHIRSNSYDIIISNGPPHSMHIIAQQLKQKLPSIKWVADFRDPWQEIDYFDELPLTKKAAKQHIKMEREVLEQADLVTTVSQNWKQLFAQKGANNVKVFTNGFLTSEFQNPIQNNNQEFTMTHLGTVSKDRNYSNLWHAIQQSENLQLQLIGELAATVHQEVQEISTIQRFGVVTRKEAIKHLQQSDALLLVMNKSGANTGRIPAKLFEYFAVGRPILYIGTFNNEAVELIQQYKAGICLPDTASVEEIKSALKQLKTFSPPASNFDAFNRKTIAKSFSQSLSDLL